MAASRGQQSARPSQLFAPKSEPRRLEQRSFGGGQPGGRSTAYVVAISHMPALQQQLVSSPVAQRRFPVCALSHNMDSMRRRTLQASTSTLSSLIRRCPFSRSCL